MIYLPCNFEVNLIAHLGVIAHFSSNFYNFNIFVLYFKNYKRWMLSLNWKIYNVQHVKIYLPTNFEVNLITHLGVIAPFPSFKTKIVLILFVLYFKNYKR